MTPLDTCLKTVAVTSCPAIKSAADRSDKAVKFCYNMWDNEAIKMEPRVDNSLYRCRLHSEVCCDCRVTRYILIAVG